MTTYATEAQLAAYLGATYAAPEDDEADRLLLRASQLIDTKTRGRAQLAYDGELSAGAIGGSILPTGPLTQAEYRTALEEAACAQVEFWMEFGEEHDIVGLQGHAMSGRLSVSQLPGRLGRRAADRLLEAGLLSARVWIK